jgi:hypothetical protein
MLKPVITRNLSNGRGRVHICWDGMVWIQQGRPHGVMANAGEAFLQPEDLSLILVMLDEFKQQGGKVLKPGDIRPL